MCKDDHFIKVVADVDVIKGEMMAIENGKAVQFDWEGRKHMMVWPHAGWAANEAKKGEKVILSRHIII